MLWAVFTVIAAAAQTVRNAMQRELTATLGTVGATHVRFLFGFPFALLFLAGVLVYSGAPLPQPTLAYWPWIVLGLAAQVTATALMLAAMNDRSFVVTIAYIKTEPVQVALFGFVLLGDKVTSPLALGHPHRHRRRDRDVGQARRGAGRRHEADLSGPRLRRLFGLSAIGYRGAILSLRRRQRFRAVRDLHAAGRAGAAVAAAVGLSRGARSRRAQGDLPRLAAVAVRRLHGRARVAILVSRPSPSPRAASVRTLALVEVLFAQGISKFVFKQPTSAREVVGIVLIGARRRACWSGRTSPAD